MTLRVLVCMPVLLTRLLVITVPTTFSVLVVVSRLVVMLLT